MEHNRPNLRIMELPPIGTNAYLMLDKASGEAALFDAPFGAMQESEKLLQKYGAKLNGVWLTHGHWDHMLDAHLFNAAGIPVFAHKADLPLIQNPDVMASFSIPGITFQAASIDGELTHEQEFTLLGQQVRVIHVPGHSPGSVAFYFPDLGWMISGDVVFAGSVGRTDFPGCSHQLLIQSIQNHVLTLDDEVILYPGHGPRTKVGNERALNPFLQGFGRS